MQLFLTSVKETFSIKYSRGLSPPVFIKKKTSVKETISSEPLTKLIQTHTGYSGQG